MGESGQRRPQGNDAVTVNGNESSSTAPLFEREAEIQVLSHVLEKSAGGTGQMALVEGPSGIGKSRLLTSVAELASSRGAEVLFTTGGELERDYPFGFVRRLLGRRISRLQPSESAHLFRGHAGQAESLFHRSADHEGPTLTDEAQLVDGLYWLVANLAEERPVVIVADDLQWGDDLSLRFLLYLVQRLEDLPIAVIGAVRTGDPAADTEVITRLSLQAATILRPQELSRDAVGQLLQNLVPEVDSHADLVDRCWTTTRGNPFLLGELTKSLTTKSTPVPDPEAQFDSAPDSVARRVMLRLSSMGGDALAVARAVAVLGRSTALKPAAALSRLDIVPAMAAAGRLTTEQIFADGPELTFYHPIIRTAVYSQYPSHERAEAHFRAAELLHEADADSDEVAVHLMRGTPIDTAWARTALKAASRSAGRNGAPGTAVTLLRRALDMRGGSPGEEADLLFDLGIMEAAAGTGSPLEHLEKALQLSDDQEVLAGAMYALGQTLFRYGRAVEARTVFRRGADLFADRDRNHSLAFEAGYTASATYLIDGLEEAHTRVNALAAPWQNIEILSPAERLLVLHLVVFRAMSSPRSPDHALLALRALGDGAQLWRETSDGMTMSHTALALTWCGRADEAAKLCTRVLDDARKRGDALIVAEISLARALAMYALGNVDDAMSDAEAAIFGMRHGWNSTVPAPHAIFAYCLIDRGDYDGAEQILVDASARLRSGATETLNVWYYMARGRLRLSRADPEKALADFLEAGSLLEVRGFMNPNYVLVPWRSCAALAAASLGDRAQARELVARDIELAREFDLPTTLGAALRVRAMVSSRQVDIAGLEESVEILTANNGSPLELARSLLELGSAMRRVGRRIDSRKPLREALDLAHTSGAREIETRAHDELLASGARPRRTSIHGASALTPSEHRIAQLLSKGLTTRAVSESLHLTISTVDWHRRNIYRKLGIGSRGELTGALDDRTA